MLIAHTLLISCFTLGATALLVGCGHNDGMTKGDSTPIRNDNASKEAMLQNAQEMMTNGVSMQREGMILASQPGKQAEGEAMISHAKKVMSDAKMMRDDAVLFGT